MRFYKFGRVICKALCKILFRIEVRGRENIEGSEGCMVISNHTSNWDPVLVGITFAQVIHFMAKVELFKLPGIGGMFYWLQAFPVDREGSDITAIKTAMKLIREKESVCIFPEGTRNIGEKPEMEAKSGAAAIACKTGVPIVPVHITGKIRPFGKIIITAGEHIRYPREEYGKLDNDGYHKISQDIIRLVRGL